MSSSCRIFGRLNLIHVCWFSFGAWLLGRSNYNCIWLVKLPPLLCIETGVKRCLKGNPADAISVLCAILIST